MSVLSTSNWLTVAEAAQLLGVTDSRVRQLLISGELPGEKFGSTWAIKKADVTRFSKIERKPGNPNFIRSG